MNNTSFKIISLNLLCVLIHCSCEDSGRSKTEVSGDLSINVDVGHDDHSDMFKNSDMSMHDSEVDQTTDEGLIIRDQEQGPILTVDMDLPVVMEDQDFFVPDQELAPQECPCFSGEGEYCAANIIRYAEEANCVLDETLNALTGDELLHCETSQSGSGEQALWTVTERCAHGCLSGEIPSQDLCDLEPCECFVRVSWCGASAGRHGETNLNCRVPLLPEHDNDILACRQGDWIVLESCQYGCVEEMTGTPDYCRSGDTNQNATWSDCPDRPLLTRGLHPEASNRLRCAGVAASAITQTIGNAAASAGYHAADGTANGLDYTAAVDIRTRDLSLNEIRALLVRLGQNGFAAWYRQPGSDGWPSSQSPHIHAVFAGVRMKSQLRGQVRDFLQNKNGLSSHSQYRFWTIPREIKDLVDQLFRRHYTP